MGIVHRKGVLQLLWQLRQAADQRANQASQPQCNECDAVTVREWGWSELLAHACRCRASGDSSVPAARAVLDRMEPWPRGRRRPICWRDWSAPTHLSWVAGGGPVEPHTEVADHGRVYGGNCRAGRSRRVDSSCGGARRQSCWRSGRCPYDEEAVERLLRRGPGCAAALRLDRPVSASSGISLSAGSIVRWWRRGWCRSGPVIA